MLKILKASAGSGKTYNLAKEYIRLILKSESAEAYRHVLAVTFTNKATDEMKRRILKELHTLARHPAQSQYLEDLGKELGMPAPQLQKRAQRQLSGILHDYSAFAVSTIDRFFQQTLRAFSREIGQFSSYQVQLDREALVSESVDRVLDALSEEDQALLDWLTESAKADLQQAGKFSLEGRLTGIASSLQSLPAAEFQRSRSELKAIYNTCTVVQGGFRQQVSAAAQAVLDALSSCGVDPAETNRGFLKDLYKYVNLEAHAALVPPTEAFVKKASDSQLWFAKSKASLLDRTEGVLEAPLQAFLELWGKPYKEYLTAGIIRDQLYGLGVASELKEAFLQIQKEKNVISLDDSNAILRDIIDGTDIPFIYEKLGVRYEDFLLDEFQDTADIQWENFRPLLHGSADAGFDSLVVGDVKQSIYRWRGGDWDLLGHRLQEEFHETEVIPLDSNYRTCREIVQFNNAFFAFAAEKLDGWLGTPGIVSGLYADVKQEVRFGANAPGSVEIAFVEDQMAEILQTLQQVRERGGEWQDIAILVRGNAEGGAIANALVKEGIPVVSDDSLYVKSSVTVRRLVSQLSLLDAPEPAHGRSSVPGFLAGSLELGAPQEGYHALTDLSENLLRALQQADPSTFQAETPYIHSFMDYLQDWVGINGNSLTAFLKAWEKASPKIASPATGNSVRVMTIHKSKGLEFPYVIVPYADKVTLYKAAEYWCRPRLEESALAAADGLYQVTLDGNVARSCFDQDLSTEQVRQAIDNINIFYVALTRPVYGLKVIAAIPPQKVQDAVNAGKDTDWKNLSHLLYSYVKDFHYEQGVPYDFPSHPGGQSGPQTVELGYPSYPAHVGGRLRFSPEAADYFGPDGIFGPEASRRIRGNVLHGILSRVAVPQDLPGAVEAAVAGGELPRSHQEATLAFLTERLNGVQERGWFSPDARALCEAPILAPDGREYRPDRVVLHPGGRVDIIDYKFGQPQDSYLRQVQRYVNLYRQMGYGEVNGYLWYLEEDIFITT